MQAEAIAQVADARSGLAREAQRRQQAEADAEEARAAASEIDEQLQAAEAVAAQAPRPSCCARGAPGKKHDGDKYEVTVGQPRKVYKRKTGPRGGYIKNANWQGWARRPAAT